MARTNKDGSKPPRKAVLRSAEATIEFALDGWEIAPLGLRSLAALAQDCVARHPSDEGVLDLAAGLSVLVATLEQFEGIVAKGADKVKRGRPAGSGRDWSIHSIATGKRATRTGKPAGRAPTTPIETGELVRMVDDLLASGQAKTIKDACVLIVKQRRAKGRKRDTGTEHEAENLARRVYNERSRLRKLNQGNSRR